MFGGELAKWWGKAFDPGRSAVGSASGIISRMMDSTVLCFRRQHNLIATLGFRRYKKKRMLVKPESKHGQS
jgi:hypothetical protein